MLNKRKVGIMMTEIDILMNNLVNFSIGKIDVNEAIKCVVVFRKELEKLMK